MNKISKIRIENYPYSKLNSIIKTINALIDNGSKSMEQYKLELVGGRDSHFTHNGERLTFADIKAAVENPNYFVYLDYANALHIPCFIVDDTGLDAVGFTAAFSVDGAPHIERVAINENEEINTHNYKIVSYENNGAVNIGKDCEAKGSNSFVQGKRNLAIGEGSHCEGYYNTIDNEEIGSFSVKVLTSQEKQEIKNIIGIDFDYVDIDDNLPDIEASAIIIYSDRECKHKVAEIKYAKYISNDDYSYELPYSGDYIRLLTGTLEPNINYYYRLEYGAKALYSHVEGNRNVTKGTTSHSEGENTSAIGFYSHSEGLGVVTIGDFSHAEGLVTISNGNYSHAEGDSTIAISANSHAEGTRTTAFKYGSHAEGDTTMARGDASHTEGYHTETSYDYQHAQGCYNFTGECEDMVGAFMHGCGTDNNHRKNAFLITDTGEVYVLGVGGYDGTNYYESLSLRELLGINNIHTTTNATVNGYQVPKLTTAQVTSAYNSIVAGRYVTIIDATGNYHLGVTQADKLDGNPSISLIFLNVMLLSYTINGNTVDIQFKAL